MRRKIPWFILSCLMILSLVLMSCAPAVTEEEEVVTEEEEGLSGEVVVAVSSLSDEFIEPFMWSRGAGNYPTGRALYDSLVRYGEQPGGIAKSWKMSEDGLTWTFELEPNLIFHNGDVCTAEDAAFGWELCMRKEVPTGTPSFASNILGDYYDYVEAVDEDTMVVHLKEPFPDVLRNCTTQLFPIPKKAFQEMGEEEFNKNPIGLGPFKLVRRVRGDFHEFEAHEDYWADGPYIKKLTIKIVPEVSTRLAMLKTGAADIADKMMGISMQEIRDDPNLSLVENKQTGWLMATFPEQHSKCGASDTPFHDVRVRQAVNYAVDRQSYVDSILYGGGEVWAHQNMIMPWDDWYDPAWDTEGYTYDPEKAKQLLTEAGYPDGFETTLYAGRGGSHAFSPEVAEAVAGDLAKVNIKANFQEIEAGVYWGNVKNQQLTGMVMFMQIPGSGNYYNLNFFHSGGTYTHYENPWYDAQVETLATLIDPEARKQLAQELSEFLYEEAIYVPLTRGSFVLGIGPKIAEWTPEKGTNMASGWETLKVK